MLSSVIVDHSSPSLVNESIERELKSFQLQMSSLAEDNTVSSPHLHKHRRSETYSYFYHSTFVDEMSTNLHKQGGDEGGERLLFIK